MFKFDFAFETISFALVFSNSMFLELLDLEFDGYDFKKILLDLQDFSENF